MSFSAKGTKKSSIPHMESRILGNNNVDLQISVCIHRVLCNRSSRRGGCRAPDSSEHYTRRTKGCQLLEGQKVEGQDGRSLLKNLKCDSTLSVTPSVTPTNTPLGPGTRGEAAGRLSPGHVSHTRPSHFLHPTCPQEPEEGWPDERRDCLLWWVAPRLVCLRQRQTAVPEESDDGLTG
ncbi:uncharacterized protein LOC123500475 [Portunus trituberculatus]|uniref:uncharacterized protein LOC123500475 n=1 Tax=Portunus trituberculatus TaxID=210409 RepID=UPI001E1D0087|nr:uncharacterized protein LOC123500475 [Portunus trituberculatus]XP_045105127.1 uncharacterized protein LOC123500475 [Portunus trituberculatus]